MSTLKFIIGFVLISWALFTYFLYQGYCNLEAYSDIQKDRIHFLYTKLSKIDLPEEYELMKKTDTIVGFYTPQDSIIHIQFANSANR